MDEQPSKPDQDRTKAYERESGTGIPRWVKLTVVVALLVGLVIVVVMLVGGGGHGPSWHGASGCTPHPAGTTAMEA
jgi:predicted PurR-regulated permease PerM